MYAGVPGDSHSVLQDSVETLFWIIKISLVGRVHTTMARPPASRINVQFGGAVLPVPNATFTTKFWRLFGCSNGSSTGIRFFLHSSRAYLRSSVEGIPVILDSRCTLMEPALNES
jgi:hypothetical protein